MNSKVVFFFFLISPAPICAPHVADREVWGVWGGYGGVEMSCIGDPRCNPESLIFFLILLPHPPQRVFPVHNILAKTNRLQVQQYPASQGEYGSLFPESFHLHNFIAEGLSTSIQSRRPWFISTVPTEEEEDGPLKYIYICMHRLHYRVIVMPEEKKKKKKKKRKEKKKSEVSQGRVTCGICILGSSLLHIYIIMYSTAL